MLVNQSLSVLNSYSVSEDLNEIPNLIFWFCSELFRPWPLWPRPAVIKSSAPCRTNTEAEEGIDLRKSAPTPQLHMFVFLLVIVRSHQLNLESLQWKCDALSSFLTANWVRVMRVNVSHHHCFPASLYTWRSPAPPHLITPRRASSPRSPSGRLTSPSLRSASGWSQTARSLPFTPESADTTCLPPLTPQHHHYPTGSAPDPCTSGTPVQKQFCELNRWSRVQQPDPKPSASLEPHRPLVVVSIRTGSISFKCKCGCAFILKVT